MGITFKGYEQEAGVEKIFPFAIVPCRMSHYAVVDGRGGGW